MKEVEIDLKIPFGVLESIYAEEKEFVHYEARDGIYNKLRNIVEDSALNYIIPSDDIK